MHDKRVWSDALDDWVSFKITTAAIKASDDKGGIDNYILSLSNEDVAKSNYLTKIQKLIGSKLYHQGLLPLDLIKHLGYDKFPPPVYEDGAHLKGVVVV